MVTCVCGLCLSRTLEYSVSALKDTCEFDHRSRWDAQYWCIQEHLRSQMSKTLLFGKIKDPESDLGILESLLGEEVHGWIVLCRGDHL